MCEHQPTGLNKPGLNNEFHLGQRETLERKKTENKEIIEKCKQVFCVCVDGGVGGEFKIWVIT